MSALKKKPAGIGVFRLPTEQDKSQYVGSLVSQWEKQAREKGRTGGTHPFVTVSRQVGCMGFDVGMKLAERLNRDHPSDIPWIAYDREIVHQIAANLNMNDRLVELLTERSASRIRDYMDSYFKGRPTVDTVFKESMRIVSSLCEKGHAILIGRGACVIGAGSPNGFHLRLTAPFAWRVERVAEVHRLTTGEAEQRVRLLEDEREGLFEKFYGRKVSDPDLYDLTLNEARFSPEVLLEVVVGAMRGKGLL